MHKLASNYALLWIRTMLERWTVVNNLTVSNKSQLGSLWFLANRTTTFNLIVNNLMKWLDRTILLAQNHRQCSQSRSETWEEIILILRTSPGYSLLLWFVLNERNKRFDGPIQFNSKWMPPLRGHYSSAATQTNSPFRDIFDHTSQKFVARKFTEGLAFDNRVVLGSLDVPSRILYPRAKRWRGRKGPHTFWRFHTSFHFHWCLIARFAFEYECHRSFKYDQSQFFSLMKLFFMGFIWIRVRIVSGC
jgi:hypothetical protein